MGSYYDSQKVMAGGTPFVHDYSQMPPLGKLYNKRLVMVLDNGAWLTAVDVTKSEEYASFYKEYASGHWITIALYTIKDATRGEFR